MALAHMAGIPESDGSAADVVGSDVGAGQLKPEANPGPAEGKGLVALFAFLFLVAVVALAGWWIFIRSPGEEPTTTEAASAQDNPVTAAEDAADEIETETQAASEFAVSNSMTAVGAAAASFGMDEGSTRACVLDGLEKRTTTDAEYRAMENPDVSTWPVGLEDTLAEILEDCIVLEPYYFAWFGTFDFQDEACVRTMTDHVLANWSWLRFLEDGILDPVLRPLLEAEFDQFVLAGYGEKGCFAASG